MSTVTTQTPWTTVDRTARTYDRFAVPPDMVLSNRETQVLTLIARGYSNKEISEELFLSINSIKTYIRGAYRRIGVERRTQAVIWAMTHAAKPIEVDLEA